MQPTLSITELEFREAAGVAILAPSLHNSQPWRFRRSGDHIQVLADWSRTPPVADADGWAARIACGAAAYNLQLAFAAQGHPVVVRWLPESGDRSVMAVLHPGPPRPPTPAQLRLFRAIPHRHSNRRPFRAEQVPQQSRAAMIQAATDEGTWLELVVGRIAVAAVAEIAHAANHVLRRNEAYTAELTSWTRRDAAVDGVPSDAGGFSIEPQDLLPQRPFSDLVRTSGKDFEPDPLVAVLGTVGDTAMDHLRAGYALQHVLLTITDHGLSSSMLSQPIEVASAREQLRIALGRYGVAQMVLRVGFGDPAVATPRRPVADVIDEP